MQRFKQQLLTCEFGEEPRSLFISDKVNHKDAVPTIRRPQRKAETLGLRYLILLRGDTITNLSIQRWEDVMNDNHELSPLFTSGATGDPKAAMLTHFEMTDIGCSGPPLFHCFGLCAGLLACFTHGAAIVFASRDFEAEAIANALADEHCTLLHGVPTVHSAILGAMQNKRIKINTIRLGIAAGSQVPPALLTELRNQMGFRDTIYAMSSGMTETSPASFMTVSSDRIEKKRETVGRILPHAAAKIVDQNNRILPRGQQGEICISGYLLQKGYYKNPAKTAEAMIQDENGVRWMHTEDEASIDEDGYCRITADGVAGENVFPAEIEERLLQHPAINQASVVSVKDQKYGEAVAAFVQLRVGQRKPTLEAMRDWIRQTLAPQKAPSYLMKTAR
ncbi:uncharacterized protein Z518_08795 [Rhinocladiella mackenziei CBS 650.93]|uniref:Rhinocladiella mackenziei CBS 650.93 unplaced genomic scaffold supercont1.6, whole genome shotgun sequence n=1 Tax=Rhinocladiella mackenziei CBS 650.93 TaxID=1442369 RepID=A0A0D2FLI2_9EURO|nr:uncharacterized protein Z518_08795 [Rhinocladiella mackenziei CBS 650.93]KIX02852.1 hypothetical protein Z518_08795 [Rhinocladiella mackenziei CBS 650.93]